MKDQLEKILIKLQTLLDELEGTLLEEVSQLSRARINPVSLQVISDNKSRLLAAINFYDEERKHAEKNAQLNLPYKNNSRLATRWEGITQVLRRSSDLNQKSNQLLEIHMERVTTLRKLIVQTGSIPSLYGEDGDHSYHRAGNSYRISV